MHLALYLNMLTKSCKWHSRQSVIYYQYLFTIPLHNVGSLCFLVFETLEARKLPLAVVHHCCFRYAGVTIFRLFDLSTVALPQLTYCCARY
eukprot:21501-Heterococcus_DN1.PRE.3